MRDELRLGWRILDRLMVPTAVCFAFATLDMESGVGLILALLAALDVKLNLLRERGE